MYTIDQLVLLTMDQIRELMDDYAKFVPLDVRMKSKVYRQMHDVVMRKDVGPDKDWGV